MLQQQNRADGSALIQMVSFGFFCAVDVQYHVTISHPWSFNYRNTLHMLLMKTAAR